jgi:hypothetical protein
MIGQHLPKDERGAEHGATNTTKLAGFSRGGEVSRGNQGSPRHGDGQEHRENLALEASATLPIGDPLARVLAVVPTLAQPEQAPAHPALVTGTAEWTRLLKRFAWGESRGRAVAQLEFGSGDLEGATLTIESGVEGISLQLQLPPGVPASNWEQRFAERLTRRGLEVADISVA